MQHKVTVSWQGDEFCVKVKLDLFVWFSFGTLLIAILFAEVLAQCQNRTIG